VQYQAPKVWSKAPKCRTRVANSIFADLFIKVSSLAQVLRVLLVVSPLIRCTMKNYAVDRGRGVLIAHDPQGRGGLKYKEGSEEGVTVAQVLAVQFSSPSLVGCASVLEKRRRPWGTQGRPQTQGKGGATGLVKRYGR
jgi:hypothetical protein